MFACLAMTLTNLAGCAAHGMQAGNIPNVPLDPTAEALVSMPEGTIIEVQINSGKAITGSFAGLSLGATALDVRVDNDARYMAPEFVDEDHLYRIPLESITGLTQVNNAAKPKPNSGLIALGIIVFGLITAAALGATHLGDDY